MIIFPIFPWRHMDAEHPSQPLKSPASITAYRREHPSGFIDNLVEGALLAISRETTGATTVPAAKISSSQATETGFIAEGITLGLLAIKNRPSPPILASKMLPKQLSGPDASAAELADLPVARRGTAPPATSKAPST